MCAAARKSEPAQCSIRAALSALDRDQPANILALT
jgi:hypothetical protein